MVYLFGRMNLGLRTRRLHTSTRNTEKRTSLYWFGPPESNPMSSCRCRLLEDCVIVQRVALPALYWLADKVGTQTPGRLRPGDQSLAIYNHCHIRQTALLESTVALSCTPSLVAVLDKVVWESSGRSSGGRVGRQLGQLGPLSGRWVFW
jgi:hypothetical protein